MSYYDGRMLAVIGKQYTFDMKPGGAVGGGNGKKKEDEPVEWVPLPDHDVVKYRPMYYGVGIVTDYDPETGIVKASFYQWLWMAYLSGPKEDFEFVRREEPGADDEIPF